VTAIDLDGEAIDEARSHCADNGVDYRLCSLEDLEETTYDRVVCINTLKHVPHAADFVSRLARHVAPEGELFVSAYITPTRDFNPCHFTEFSRRSLLRLLRRHGFVPVSEFVQIKRFRPGRSVDLMKNKRRPETDAPAQPPLIVRYALRPDRAARRAWSLVRDGLTTKNLLIRTRRLPA
jgi:SAM-dependent methyltransferase